MDSNREEAMRAKQIAENKMQNKDFSGARKIALRAQQLYPELENISQVIMVCDVLCAFEHKVLGSETDWYGILKLEPTADDLSIKKQYKRFALVLHPDKNKFSGATEAFKLIGEAQRVLLDSGKRMLHDTKCKVSTTASPSWDMPAFPKYQETFWTLCPSCFARYQYRSHLLNKLLRCPNCKSSFIGLEITSQQKEVPNQGAFKASLGGNSQGNVRSGAQPRESVPKAGSFKLNPKKECASEVGGNSKNFGTCGIVDASKKGGVEESRSFGRENGKERNKVTESSESCNTGTISDFEEEGNVFTEENFGCYGEYPRRSTRSKQNVSYSEYKNDGDCDGDGENLGDSDDCGRPLKRANCIGSFCAPEIEEQGPDINEPDDPEIYEYPDPDFSDFDKDRNINCFAVGQTWAIYDVLDAMPRFHAQIREVFSPGFRLRLTWLEPEPDNEDGIKWVEGGLPTSCGTFKHGNSENTEDHAMFSHLVHLERGSSRSTFKIYPRKGETWALFKNWDIKWHTNVDRERKYEFEFVEVLSEYDEISGVSVSYLGKLRGFSCLFSPVVREGMSFSCQIPSNQLFRFSHRVPSFAMSGAERNDVPKGSFELDPACLPTNLDEVDARNLKVEAASIPSDISCSEQVSSRNCNGYPVADSPPSSPEAYDIPDTEFYNFDREKCPEKFQVGQFWALYSDVDGLPKCYAQIKKINRPEFRLHITWLIPSSLQNNTTQWLDKNMLTTCGKFCLEKGKTQEYTEIAPFSHKLRVALTDMKGEYAVVPWKGDVWAIYKNWNDRITRSKLLYCEYEMVQILEENDLDIKVLVLEPVSGFKTVFRAQMKDGSPVTLKFPQKEMIRFSHQIPAFRLTEERDGSLRGYWELHPAALPVRL